MERTDVLDPVVSAIATSTGPTEVMSLEDAEPSITAVIDRRALGALRARPGETGVLVDRESRRGEAPLAKPIVSLGGPPATAVARSTPRAMVSLLAVAMTLAAMAAGVGLGLWLAGS